MHLLFYFFWHRFSRIIQNNSQSSRSPSHNPTQSPSSAPENMPWSPFVELITSLTFGTARNFFSSCLGRLSNCGVLSLSDKFYQLDLWNLPTVDTSLNLRQDQQWWCTTVAFRRCCLFFLKSWLGEVGGRMVMGQAGGLVTTVASGGRTREWLLAACHPLWA